MMIKLITILLLIHFVHSQTTNEANKKLQFDEDDFNVKLKDVESQLKAESKKNEGNEVKENQEDEKKTLKLDEVDPKIKDILPSDKSKESKETKEVNPGQDYELVDEKEDDVLTDQGKSDSKEKDLSKDNKDKQRKRDEIEREDGYDGSKEDGEQPILHDQARNANSLMDKLIDYLKREYKSQFDSLAVSDIGPIKHGRWGSISLHHGFLKGLMHLQRAGDVLIKPMEDERKSLFGNIAITDAKMYYNVDANLFHSFAINNREIHLNVGKMVMYLDLELDKKGKKVTITDLRVESIEDFQSKSGKLFWPLNKIVDWLCKKKQLLLKEFLMEQAKKFVGKSLHDVNLDFIDLIA